MAGIIKRVRLDGPDRGAGKVDMLPRSVRHRIEDAIDDVSATRTLTWPGLGVVVGAHMAPPLMPVPRGACASALAPPERAAKQARLHWAGVRAPALAHRSAALCPAAHSRLGGRPSACRPSNPSFAGTLPRACSARSTATRWTSAWCAHWPTCQSGWLRRRWCATPAPSTTTCATGRASW